MRSRVGSASLVSVEDFRRAARRSVPRFVADYIEGGAEDECCLRRNEDDLRKLCLVPRHLRDTSAVDASVEVFGQRWSAPFGIAPIGLSGLVRPHGDVLMAKAAASAGVPFVMSSASNSRLETVRSVGGGGGIQWMQLYVMSDRSIAEHIVKRARRENYGALVLTVDVVVNGKRERDLRNGFRLPLWLTASTLLNMLKHPAWMWRLARYGMPAFVNLSEIESATLSPQAQAALMSREMDRRLVWENLDWLRRLWDGPLLIKGVLHPDDARRALMHGADGVIVSNHGGRQLDAAPSAIAALPAVVDAVGGRIPVFVDGGFRRGSDVVKALSLGAKAVFVGRPAVYGLASGGERGVQAVLQILIEEIERTMVLLGAAGTSELGSHTLFASHK
jgi:(S)-mandelate dehydrogenase